MVFESLTDEELLKEAVNIVETAKNSGITIRVLGAIAVFLHSLHDLTAINLYEKIKRLGENKSKFTDLDLIGYGQQRKQIMHFFEKILCFKPNLMENVLFGSKRLIYSHPKGFYHVDIFFDKLEFSHDVHFGEKIGKGRLELDYPTITLADIVLEKVQIHNISLKDIIDLIVLFASHDVDLTHDKEVIDGNYIAKVLADDWGFWYDAVHNLEVVQRFSSKFYSENKLVKEVHNLISNRIDKLLKIIDETPKTKNWLKRAKIGTSKPWYREVEEVIR
jgi:hypothetical protein